jgi:hypothetical protein
VKYYAYHVLTNQLKLQDFTCIFMGRYHQSSRWQICQSVRLAVPYSRPGGSCFASFCDLGKKVEEGVNCREGGHECWRLRKEVLTHVEPVPKLLIESRLLSQVVSDSEFQVFFEEFTENILTI